MQNEKIIIKIAFTVQNSTTASKENYLYLKEENLSSIHIQFRIVHLKF